MKDFKMMFFWIWFEQQFLFKKSLIVVDYSFISRKIDSPLVTHSVACCEDAYTVKMKLCEERNRERSFQ